LDDRLDAAAAASFERELSALYSHGPALSCSIVNGDRSIETEGNGGGAMRLKLQDQFVKRVLRGVLGWR
jgi:hypothetical protein